MSAKPPNARTPDWDIDSMFVDRWSPRAFLSDPLTEREIQTLFEAARWAPSCYNEQPWLFVYATAPEQRQKLVACLMAKNQLWAGQAPVVMFVLARRNFQKTGKENRHAPFDAGAAWMALALQARKLGLYAHAMAGFNQDKAYETLGVSRDEFHVMAAIAVGRLGDASGLPDDLRAMESPNSRKPHAEVATDLFPLFHKFSIQIGLDATNSDEFRPPFPCRHPCPPVQPGVRPGFGGCSRAGAVGGGASGHRRRRDPGGCRP